MTNKNMKKAAVLFFLAALGFYLTSIIGFISDSSLAGMYLCLGCAFLLLGATNLRKARETTAPEETELTNNKEEL